VGIPKQKVTGSCTTSGQITGQSHLSSQREIFPGKMSGVSAALSEKLNGVKSEELE